MVDNRYNFGCTIRDAIVSGSDRKTELRTIFEDKLFQRLGISAGHSYFNCDLVHPYIYVHAYVNETNSLFPASEWTELQNVFYPKGKARKLVFDCFNDSVLEIGLPTVNFPTDETIDAVSIANYKSVSVNIYFNVNIAELDRKTRQAFPNIRFHLRFCMSCRMEHYYLIFDDLSGKERADTDGTTLKIVDFVFSLCEQNDPLHIFYDNEVTPIITTKEEIIKKGMAMGIMRNNPGFETL